MRVILDVNPDKYSKINRLVEDKRYDSVSQFIDAAIENQLHLESVSPIEGGSDIDDSLGTGFNSHIAPSELGDSVITAASPSPVTTVDEPMAGAVGSDHLWMMTNRFLPIKVALRAIGSYLSTNPSSKGWTNITAVYEAVMREAIKTGRFLHSADTRRSVGDKLAIGFPSSRDEKSQSRFKWFCIGVLKSNGRIAGGPAKLRFVNIARDSSGNVVMGLTRAGVDFSNLRNPVLDLNDLSTPTALSQAETDYLWSHISRVLPTERRLMVSVMDSIARGLNTPNVLTEPVQSILNKDDAESISHRASLVSRLAELVLVVGRKNGLRVTYQLTDRGRAVLASQAPQASLAR